MPFRFAPRKSFALSNGRETGGRVNKDMDAFHNERTMRDEESLCRFFVEYASQIYQRSTSQCVCNLSLADFVIMMLDTVPTPVDN
jgi:hypothetical protein